MSKKPRLSLVDLNATATSAPPSLGKSGAKLWRSIQDEYRIEDAGGLALLTQLCLAIDRADECAAVIAVDGPMIRTKNGPRDHPLLKTELASRSFAVKSLLRLGLDVEPTRSTTGRPPGSFNVTRP